MSNITIALLRDDIKTPDQAIAKNIAGVPIAESGKSLGTLFVSPGKSGPPKWGKLFAPKYIPEKKLGVVQSTGAVFILETDGRMFAISFGTGRHLIDPAAVTERFGLLVVLNSVASDGLRSIDMRSFDTVDQNSRVQTSQSSPASEFGIDIERDLVRGVTGKPTDERIGKRLTGADTLTAAVSCSLDDLPGLCSTYLKQFRASNYQKSFSWIDNIHQIAPHRKLRDELDLKLIEALEQSRKSAGAKGCWLALPNIVDWDRICRFRYSKRQTDPTHSDIHLPGFFASLDSNEPITVDLLKRKRAYAVDDENESIVHWNIYECVHCEIDLTGRSYVLSGGHWFEVAKEFVEEVDEYFAKSIERYADPLLDYEHPSEGEYNSALVKSDPSKYALMDCDLITVGGVHETVEFCDVYTIDRHLIHVKKYGGSGLLGHLFSQGLVSGELLRNDRDYVAKVNAKLGPAFQIKNDSAPRAVDGFTIVYAIISESKDPLHVPFFARVALRHAHRSLISMGFPVKLAKIQVTDKFSQDQKKIKKAKTIAKKAAKKAAAVSALP